MSQNGWVKSVSYSETKGILDGGPEGGEGERLDRDEALIGILCKARHRQR